MTARGCLVSLCLIASLTGCTEWVAYDPGPPGVEWSEVRITKASGQQVEVTSPFIDGPEYVGNREGAIVRVPLDSIAGFEVKRTDGGATVVVSVAVTAGLFIAAAVLAAVSTDWSGF